MQKLATIDDSLAKNSHFLVRCLLRNTLKIYLKQPICIPFDTTREYKNSEIHK
jgi:hypothetical protein